MGKFVLVAAFACAGVSLKTLAISRINFNTLLDGDASTRQQQRNKLGNCLFRVEEEIHLLSRA